MGGVSDLMIKDQEGTLTEEEQKTFDVLKGERYYRLQLSGYGGEASYMKISKEAHDFWAEHTKQGDGDMINYILAAENGTVEEIKNDKELEWNNLDPNDLTFEVCFLHEDENDVGSTWFEPPNEFEHVWGVAYDSANITIDEYDGAEYSSTYIKDVVEYTSLSELNEQVGEESEWNVELVWSQSSSDMYPEKGTYIAQMYSAEKGGFFDAYIVTYGEFDIKKLKIQYGEAPNGEDTVIGVEYDGEEVYNDNGGDTNGKGYYAGVWQQEF